MSESNLKSINWWTFLHDHPKNVLIWIFVSGGEFVSEIFPIIFVEAPNPLKNSSSLKFSLHGCLSIECGETGVPTLIYNTHQFLSNTTRFCSHNDYTLLGCNVLKPVCLDWRWGWLQLFDLLLFTGHYC